MAAFALRVLLIVLFPSFLFAQSLSLSVSAGTQSNNPSTFLLDGNKVTLTSDQLRFAHSGKTISNFVDVDVSADESIISVLKQSGEDGTISLFNSRGELLTSYATIILSSDDPSQAVYTSNNGNVLLRDNITHFTFYDTFGGIAASMSSSSQSKDGEKISQVVASENQSATVIYNPQIKRDSDLGSKAQYKQGDNNFEQIFYSRDRYLKNVTISENGDLVILLTAKSGSQDQAVIMDAYGNVLNTISVDDNLKGAAVSPGYDFITLYSNSRVMVYSMLDGNRLGSTSLSSTVFVADYFPEDNLILAVTGNYSSGSGIMNNVTFEAINLQQRSITSERLSGNLGFRSAITPKLVRISDDHYQLQGGSKKVNIEANF